MDNIQKIDTLYQQIDTTIAEEDLRKLSQKLEMLYAYRRYEIDEKRQDIMKEQETFEDITKKSSLLSITTRALIELEENKETLDKEIYTDLKSKYTNIINNTAITIKEIERLK